jgi:hypothetical protein
MSTYTLALRMIAPVCDLANHFDYASHGSLDYTLWQRDTGYVESVESLHHAVKCVFVIELAKWG